MKTSIETLLNSYVSDNKKSIIENGGNAAEYILADTEAQDQGWLWFLSDEEITDFEENKDARKRYIQEIRDFVNSNFNYKLKSDDLMIIRNTMSDELLLVREGWFETKKLCETYDNNGQQVGCYNAGCYAFENSSCDIHLDFYIALSGNFGIGSLMDDNDLTSRDLVELLSDNEDSGIFPEFGKMVEFFENWKEENETHTEISETYNYWNGNNHQTVTLDTDYPTDLERIDSELEDEILEDYENCSSESESNGFIYYKGEKYGFVKSAWATSWEIATVSERDEEN